MPEKLSKYVKISIFHTCTELVFSLKSAFILTMDLSLSLSPSLSLSLSLSNGCIKFSARNLEFDISLFSSS